MIYFYWFYNNILITIFPIINIRSLNDSKIKQLEEKVNVELDKRKESVINAKKEEKESQCNHQTTNFLDNRGIEEDNEHFNQNISPKYIDIKSY